MHHMHDRVSRAVADHTYPGTFRKALSHHEDNALLLMTPMQMTELNARGAT